MSDIQTLAIGATSSLLTTTQLTTAQPMPPEPMPAPYRDFLATINRSVASTLEPCPPLGEWRDDVSEEALLSPKKQWRLDHHYMAGPLRWDPTRDYASNDAHAVELMPHLIMSRVLWQPDGWCCVWVMPPSYDTPEIAGGDAPTFALALSFAFLTFHGHSIPPWPRKEDV
jgi:hypothetical protein